MSKILPRFHRGIAKVLGVQLRGRLPDFFICGAARCGTTSLWRYLQQHPEIYLPKNTVDKEPSYFCETYGMQDRSHYLALFADAQPDQRIGEASGPYLTSPESAGWIQSEVPNARILILLRNPVERAYSLYKWMRENGFERCETFSEALWAEENTRAGNEWFRWNSGQYGWNYLYFRSGLYSEQIQRYFDAFGRESVKVLIFEEFTRNVRESLPEVFAFLGVDPAFRPQIEVHNSTLIQTPMDEGCREDLTGRYRPEAARLEALLGRTVAELWGL